GPGRLCRQRLSPAVRDLHRAGDPGARTARARYPDRVVAPPDRPDDASRASPDPGAGAVPAGIPQGRAATRVAELAACAAAARLPDGVADLAHGSAARPDPEPDPPLWPGIGAGGRIAGRQRTAGRAFS